jgi:hypothetical protein
VTRADSDSNIAVQEKGHSVAAEVLCLMVIRLAKKLPGFYTGTLRIFSPRTEPD